MDYKTASREELNQFVADSRKELGDLRFGAAGSKNRNVKRAHTLKKEIARALTALNTQQAILS